MNVKSRTVEGESSRGEEGDREEVGNEKGRGRCV